MQDTPAQTGKTTVWHITFGTYGSRLHGDGRGTVARPNNKRGDPYIILDPWRAEQESNIMRHDPVILTHEQRRFIEANLPKICEKGGWRLIACAAGPDHVHTLLEADSRIHGRRIRPLLKRWLTQNLEERWRQPRRPDGMGWWVQGGSTKAVKHPHYLQTAIRYITEQRATPRSSGSRSA